MSAARALPRILAIMGSGETAPTLAKVHRSILGRLGPPPVPAVLVDTAYGFQENAEDISGRTIDYFRESVGAPIGVASFRSAAVGALERTTATARIREAAYVFAGPGSPSYALRQWRGSEIPDAFADKLERGGALTFASAAALTIGLLTVPVYEIYKVGDEPAWLEGLDLLTAIGLRVAVVPHYDNAEGGNHDTRFCYLGQRRLEMLEAAMPDDAWILGVDGHTALVLDLDGGSATVAGLGGVTARSRGESIVFPAGSTLTLDELIAAGRGCRPGSGKRAPHDLEGASAGGAIEGIVDRETATRVQVGGGDDDGGGRGGDDRAAGPDGEPGARPIPQTLTGTAEATERAFETGLADREPSALVRAVLELDDAIVEWSRDTGLAGDYERARSVLRSLIVRLGDVAVAGVRDPREAVSPFVEALLELRVRARESRDWATADLIRDRLTDAGIEVHDGPDGTTWAVAASRATAGSGTSG